MRLQRVERRVTHHSRIWNRQAREWPDVQSRTVHGPSCQNPDLDRVSRSVDSVVNTSSQISEAPAIALQCSKFATGFRLRRCSCAARRENVRVAIRCFYGEFAMQCVSTLICAEIAATNADFWWMMKSTAPRINRDRNGCVTGRLLTTLSTRYRSSANGTRRRPAAIYQENA